MFGSMAPMAMRPNAMMGTGMQMLDLAKRMQQPGAGGGAQQGLLQRLLNPSTPPGTPTNLGAPGMNPDGSKGQILPQFMQAGILPRLMPQVFGGAGGGAPMGANVPPPTVPPNPLGGLY